MELKDNIITILNGAKDYIAKGFDVMPVRMADVSEKLKAKSPLFSFKTKREDCSNVDAIFQRMNYSDVENGLALVTGTKIGDNYLEVIDIDEKYQQGVSMIYLETIEKYYPNIYTKLRLETTINNGVHIPYLTPKIEGSKDLAKRYATEEELKNNSQKQYCFIETRGMDSLCIMYPTRGYNILKDNDIPTLTAEERDTLIKVALSFNKVKPKEVVLKVSKKGFNNYNLNPWEDYNDRGGEDLIPKLIKHGFSIESDTAHHIYFSRPGKKSGISFSYVKETGAFYNFSPNTDNLEPYTGYNASTLLCIYEFDNDNKECYKWLINNGYGKLNANYENNLIKTAVTNGFELPNNISENAKKEFEKLKKNHENLYPHGIFWEQDDNGFKINRELILRVSKKMNFYLLEGNLIKLEDGIIYDVGEKDFFETLKGYIKESKQNDYDAICDKYESYLQNSGKFLITRLDEIDENLILKDTRNTSFKVFVNCIVKITKSKISILEYGEIDKYILNKNIIDFYFEEEIPKGLYVDFISKAIEPNEHTMKYLGYLLHGYKDSSGSYAILATESVLNPKDGGGAGKNILGNLLNLMTTYKDVPASQIQLNEKLFQSWNGEKVMSISDTPKDFDFDFLKNIISNSAIVKKLYKDEKDIPAEKLPKLLLSTNFSINITDGGLKRRIKILEFTDFFTKKGGVDVYYGNKMFPTDWSEEDYSGYYNYSILCIQEYLKAPKLEDIELSEGGWTKQFIINFKENTYDFIAENINDFIRRHEVESSFFNDKYHSFRISNDLKHGISNIKMNNALEEYCKRYGIHFEKNKVTSINGVSKRFRVFGDNNTNNEDVEDDLPF